MVSTLLRVTEVMNIASFSMVGSPEELVRSWKCSVARARQERHQFLHSLGGYKGYFLSFVTIVTEFVQPGHSRYVVCTLGMICLI